MVRHDELEHIIVRARAPDSFYVDVRFITLNGQTAWFGMTYPASHHGLVRAIRAREFLIDLRDGDSPWIPVRAREKLCTFYHGEPGEGRQQPLRGAAGRLAGSPLGRFNATALLGKLQHIHKSRKVLAKLRTAVPNLDPAEYEFVVAEWEKGWVASSTGVGGHGTDTS